MAVMRRICSNIKKFTFGVDSKTDWGRRLRLEMMGLGTQPRDGAWNAAGARFSNVPETFRTREAISKTMKPFIYRAFHVNRFCI